MQAKETKLQDIIEGTKQYVIPLFQRTYSWTAKEWDTLWKDLVELSEMDNPRTHFIGSIVNMPTVSVPEGVAKYLLIDGQQRLTTIFILLTLLRNKARENQSQRFADEINNTLLVNPFKDGPDYFKLMPTQVDRKPYIDLLMGKNDGAENQLTKCYTFFENKLKQSALDPEKIKKIITSYFSVVSIVLDSDDNPYLVFESLNAKGRPLTQADLIRNYFFMRIHFDQQDSVYQEYWYPMQQALGDNLTEFIRHFLMRTGSFIRQSDVYYSLKAQVSTTNAIEYLQELKKFSIYYQRILFPDFEPHPTLQKYLRRLNRIEVTTAYPLMLYFYDNYEQGFISVDEFTTILKTLENYLIRRFVCSVPTNQLNKIFSAVVPQLITKFPENICEGFQLLLQDKGYPKDFEFIARFKDTNFYGAGDRREKTKFVLETLEESYNHKESPSFTNLTIEHIMPQTLDEWWQHHLGETWQETFDQYLDTIGNLTLTAYNSELSNDQFSKKRVTYNDSHLELNKYFSALTQWTATEIQIRAEFLALRATEIWSYFGQDRSAGNVPSEVTGTSPVILTILGQDFRVTSWRDVLECTLNTVADLEPEKFEVIATKLPRFIGRDNNRFHATRKLQNGYFFEVNLSAQSIQRVSYQVMEAIELTSDDWYVTLQ